MPVLRHRLLPLLVLLVILTLGAGLTLSVARLEGEAVQARFERMADQIAARLRDRLGDHVALLRGAAGYVEAEDAQMTAPQFARYVRALGLSDHYRGVQGIGFARLLPQADAAQAVAEISRHYGIGVEVHPPVVAPWSTPIVLLEPQDARNRAALGYDMYAEPVRRAAIARAVATLQPAASGPVELVQEITAEKQAGFLIYYPALLPDGAGGQRVAGLAYAPFRIGDLHRAALAGLEDLPVALRSFDAEQPSLTIYASAETGAETGAEARLVTRKVEVAGRNWRIEVAALPGLVKAGDYLLTGLVGILSLLLALASAAGVRGTQAQIAAVNETLRLSEKVAHDRRLLLQEMKHRIKNHIARIQAIARYTRREVDDLDAFEKAFGGRLMSMAAAQDLLTADGGSADLKALIAREMGQVMLADQVEAALSGPEVRLNAEQARAMSLVIHELTTNALKYGRGAGRRIAVDWTVDGGTLALRWRETGGTAPEAVVATGKGFGTQLIEALIEGDLNGHLHREIGPQGVRVEIGFPLAD